MRTSTPYSSQSKYSNHGGGAAVPPYVTLGILVAGVLGGLAIVIAVILCCKYCVNRNKGRERGDIVESRLTSERDRRYNKPLQRYETINSDMFSEPSTGSMDGLPISPRKVFDSKSMDNYVETDEINETTRLKADFERVSYKDIVDEHDTELKYVKVDNNQSEAPATAKRESDRGTRYTDGDFHHLKKARIEKGVSRQYSLGTSVPCHSKTSPTTEKRQPISFNETFANNKEYDSMKTIRCGDSPSPSLPSQPTEICVEIHQQFTNQNKDKVNSDQNRLTPFEKGRRFSGLSHSLDATSERKHKDTGRKTRSFEDIGDYDILKITEFKGPFYNTDFNAINELGSPGGSKVRYNDTGSMEQLDEDNLDFYEEFEMDSLRLDESDDTETLNGTQKYRELWNLRTTFEEEEECSDTIRMEDMTSPDQSPEGDMPQYYTTSFESNTESIPYTENSDQQRKLSVLSVDFQKPSCSNLLHPNYENRRQTYKNILARRLQPGNGGASNENSIDSVETVDTDGEVSDTSRYEVTTTSFESTTDNTDSATEGQNHRLIQMKADSGYKSLETQPFLHGAVKRNHSTGEIDEEIEELEMSVTTPERVFMHAHSLPEPGPSGSRCFDRRNAKTASKKRREFSRERQIVHVYESINEPETDSKSDQPSGDSFEEAPQSNKLSVFARIFRPHKDVKHRTSSLARDYSIDEKTNRVFQEYIRYDPKLDNRVSLETHSRPRRIHRHRLHRKHSDVKYFEDRRRDRLAPDLRSTSLGSDSSASSVRRLSPQDSIEEEDYDVMKEEEEWERQMLQKEVQQRQSVSIPIIKLPEEESSNA